MRLWVILAKTVLIVACAGAWGCASISVRDAKRSKRVSGKPVLIEVKPFTYECAKLSYSAWNRAPGQLAPVLSDKLSRLVVSELEQRGLPARLTAGAGAREIPARSGAVWRLTGRITRLSEGNRLLRMGIGLGAGGTKFETEVGVYEAPSRRPFLQFVTTGGSNAEPGALTNPVPFSAGPTALVAARNGLNADAARTARVIARTVAEEAGVISVRK